MSWECHWQLKKPRGPVTKLSILGIELDTVQSVARLPKEKLDKCHDMIVSFLLKKKVKLRTLIGLINFACCVVPGRPFLRRLIDRMRGIQKPYYKINLNKETKQDLNVWLSFLKDFNGKSFFRDDLLYTSASLNLYTDAAKEFGFGAILGQEWLYGNSPEPWKAYNIVTLELFPIVLALEEWGELKNPK